MNGREKSDPCVVPGKPANKAAPSGGGAGGGKAGGLGERGPAKHGPNAEPGFDVSQALDRIREAAARDKSLRLTALLHHVTPELLEASYRALNRDAAPGADGTTWWDYGGDLEARLRDLHGRIHRGAYRAQPSVRRYIPKPDGGQRALVSVRGLYESDESVIRRPLLKS